MSSSDMANKDEGLERGTEKCDACNTPVSTLVKVKVADESGEFVDQLWCRTCFMKGDDALEQKEQGK
jgi:hypothetical protein